MFRRDQHALPARSHSRLRSVPALFAAIIVSLNCCHGGDYVAQMTNLLAASNNSAGTSGSVVAQANVPGQPAASCHSHPKSSQTAANDGAPDPAGDHATCPGCNRSPVVQQDGQKIKLDQDADADGLDRARNFAVLSHGIAPLHFDLRAANRTNRRLSAQDLRPARTTGTPVYIFHQSFLI